ncbi:MAG: ATP-binding protein [Abitibacteriaceae bacterium]|nr:ATP-binding protein [Abditibacteriaceae bacterium]MBV9868054.1 ATP-binding protein [Abditibacteriaceae bacterium]
MPPNPPAASTTQATFWSFDGAPQVLQSYRAEFAGSRDSLKAIRDLAESAAAHAHMGEIAVTEFEMAVDEICANIVEHSYEKHGSHTLLIEIALFSNRIECIVTDHSAVRFPITTAPTHGLDSFFQEERKRGLGLDIIRHSLDKVEHQWLSPQGNQTRLIKFYSGQQQ